MTHRIFSNRRIQEVVDFEQDGYQYRIAVSRFGDGSPAEVHIDSARAGSILDTHGRDIAALITLLLQSGVDVLQIEQSLDRNLSGLAARVARLIRGAA